VAFLRDDLFNETLLLSKGLTFSSHSAVIAAYGKGFAKTGLLDPKFHHCHTETP